MPHSTPKKPAPIARHLTSLESIPKTPVLDSLPAVPPAPPLPKAAPYAQLPEFKAVKLNGTYKEIFDKTPPPPLKGYYGRTESSWSSEFLDIAEIAPVYTTENGKLKASGVEKAYYLLRVKSVVYLAEWDPPEEATTAQKEEWERFILLTKTLHEQGHVDRYNKVVGKHFFNTAKVIGTGKTQELAKADLFAKIKSLGNKDLDSRWAAAVAENEQYDVETNHGETQNCVLKASP